MSSLYPLHSSRRKHLLPSPCILSCYNMPISADNCFLVSEASGVEKFYIYSCLFLKDNNSNCDNIQYYWILICNIIIATRHSHVHTYIYTNIDILYRYVNTNIYIYAHTHSIYSLYTYHLAIHVCEYINVCLHIYTPCIYHMPLGNP
jgi:hypothetical protein